MLILKWTLGSELDFWALGGRVKRQIETTTQGALYSVFGCSNKKSEMDGSRGTYGEHKG